MPLPLADLARAAWRSSGVSSDVVLVEDGRGSRSAPGVARRAASTPSARRRNRARPSRANCRGAPLKAVVARHARAPRRGCRAGSAAAKIASQLVVGGIDVGRPRGRASAAARPSRRPRRLTSACTGRRRATARSETAIRSLPGGSRADVRERLGRRLGTWRSPGAGPLTASRNSALSSTRPGDAAGHAHAVPVLVVSGISDTRPRCGLSPNRPQQAAGMRIEPPPSEAVAAGAEPGGHRGARCRRSSRRACGRGSRGCA